MLANISETFLDQKSPVHVEARFPGTDKQPLQLDKVKILDLIKQF